MFCDIQSAIAAAGKSPSWRVQFASVEKGISRSDKAGPERSDEHPGRRTESRYAMIEQLLVQYGAKVSCAGLRVSRSAFYRWKSGQESRRAREQREIVQKITKA